MSRDHESERAVNESTEYDGGVAEQSQFVLGESADRHDADRARAWLFVMMQAAWMLVALFTLAALGMATLELLFVVSFIGLLVNALVFAPTGSVPTWWVVVRWVIRAGFVALGYFVYLQVQDIVA